MVDRIKDIKKQIEGESLPSLGLQMQKELERLRTDILDLRALLEK